MSAENLAMQESVTPLANGLFLHRRTADVFVILYPTEVVNAVQRAFDARLLVEKSGHVAALDALDEAKAKREQLEARILDLNSEIANQRRVSELLRQKLAESVRSVRARKSARRSGAR